MPELSKRMDPAKFIVDCMLGSLAKWLRILGQDVRYDPELDDDALVEIAGREGRLLVTRDTRLVRRRALRRPILIASQELPEQIRQVVRDTPLRIDPDRLLSRCLECNLPTREASRESVRGRVPPYVFRTQERFSRCLDCGRIYWQATHVTRMLERLRKELRLPLMKSPR